MQLFYENTPVRCKCTFLFTLISGLILIAVLLINGNTTEIDPDVFRNAVVHIFNGDIPYKDFPYEFPPLAFVFITIPGLFSTDPLGYRIAFAVFAYLFIIGAYYLMLLTVERWKGDDSWTLKLAIPMAIFMLLFVKQMFCKNDAFIIFFVALGIYMYVRDKRLVAYIVMTAAAFIKIYPVIFVFAFFLMDLLKGTSKERLTNAGTGVAVTIATQVAICAPLLLMHVTIPEMFNWMTIHNGRGFQAESTVAIFVEFFGQLGLWDYTLVESYSTLDVQSFITDALSPNWSFVVVQLMLIVFLCVVYHAHTNKPNYLSPETLQLYLGTLILTFIISNKVFSTQYMMWLLPLFFLPLFKDHKKRVVLYTYLVLAMVFSMSYNVFNVTSIVLLFIRNIMLFLLEAYLIMALLGHTKHADQTMDRIFDKVSSIFSKKNHGPSSGPS